MTAQHAYTLACNSFEASFIDASAKRAYRDRVDLSKIITDSRWRHDIPLDRTGTQVRFDSVPVY